MIKADTQPTQRVVLVSNRLPFTVAQQGDAIEFYPSAGGVASGLHALLTSKQSAAGKNGEYLWIGWPGAAVPEALSRYRASPVFLSEAEIDAFYAGFCNKTLWPLFH
jgi:trehalose 6-phosphate synthase/phosphatase